MQDKSDELFIEVNQHDEPIGAIPRHDANTQPKRYHRSIKVLVFNTQGELLIQKRSEHKDTFPNSWDVSVAGHVDWGETYLQAAMRETKEEIGLHLAPESLHLLGKLLIQLPWETEFQQAYKVELETDQPISFPTDEVSEVKWVSPVALRELLNDETTTWTSPAKTHLRAFGYW